MQSEIQMPDQMFLVGTDKIWSELGDTEVRGRITGCALTVEEAEAKCRTQDDWVVVIFPNSGRAMKQYYPRRDDD
jgi:hypothetical protein